MGNITERLNKIADYHGLKSYSDFSKKTGLSFQTASNYLKGHRKPTIEKLSFIKQSFDDINERWLLTGEGSMLKESSVVNGDNNISVQSSKNIKVNDIVGAKNNKTNS